MEQYVKQPLAVEVFDLGDKTDIILRRDIQQTQQRLEDGGTQTIWTCEERQHRVPGSYTAEDVQANFDAWWDYTPPVPDTSGPTPAERLADLEAENEMLTSCILELSQIVYS